MKFAFSLTVAIIAVGLLPQCIAAQHSDIEFGYDNTTSPTGFVIEQDNMTTDGIQFFEAEFDEFAGDYFSDDPGFVTNDAEGLLVNSGDDIWVNFLDASTNSAFGVGFLNYYNPVTDSLEAIGRLSVSDNAGAGTDDLILAGASIESGVNPQFLGTGDVDGDIHDHISFDLLDDATAPDGAYGVLVQLQADFDTPDGNMDLSSAPFWIIYNKNMTESDFEENALPAFGVAPIPEPGSVLFLGLGATVLLIRRRRK